MTTPNKNTFIVANLIAWFIAMVLNPLAQLVPSAAGGPPKIFQLLIPIFILMLAGYSTYLLKSAFDAAPQNGASS